jgi:hypothetical protein
MFEAALVAGEEVDDGMDELSIEIVRVNEENSARWLEEVEKQKRKEKEQEEEEARRREEEEAEQRRKEAEEEEMKRREEEEEDRQRREAEEEEAKRREAEEAEKRRREEEIQARLARIRAFKARRAAPEVKPVERMGEEERKNDGEAHPAEVEAKGKEVEEAMEVDYAELPVAGSDRTVRVRREPGKPGPSGTVYIGAPPERGRLLRAAPGDEKGTRKRTGVKAKAGPPADNVRRQKGDQVSAFR